MAVTDISKAPVIRAALDRKRLASKIATALRARESAETSVIVSTLAIEGQGCDFDCRIAESLRVNAWDKLAKTYIALQEAMHLIPEADRPEGFALDSGAVEDESIRAEIGKAKQAHSESDAVEMSDRASRKDVSGANLDDAKVALSHANGVIEMVLNLLEQQLGELSTQNLADLEDNLGVRRHTLVTALNTTQRELDRTSEILEEVSRG